MATYPNTTSASDIWSLRDVYKAEAGDEWPTAQPDFWQYFNGFETGDVTTSGVSTFQGGVSPTISIIENDGTESTADKQEGTYSYFADSVSASTTRLVYTLPIDAVNAYDNFKVEFYFKATNTTSENYPTTFHMFGGSETTYAFFRSNQPDRAGTAAGVGDTLIQATNAWPITWTNWNKFTYIVDRTSSTNNMSLYLNDVLEETGTVPQTLVAYANSALYISFYQFVHISAGDNGVAGYLDNVIFTGYDN
jgi:hypothetical protein